LLAQIGGFLCAGTIFLDLIDFIFCQAVIVE